MKNKSVRSSVVLLIVAALALLALAACQTTQPPPPPPGQPQPGQPQPGQAQPGQPQPGQPQPGQPQPGQPQPGQPQPGQPQPGQPQPGQPPTPGQPPAPTQAPGSGCAAPVIPYFNANPSQITAGQSSTLSWGDVYYGNTQIWAQSTVINPGLGEVGSGASSRPVTPMQTTTYTLVSTGCGSTATKQVTIVVTPSGSGQPPSGGGSSGCAGAPVIPFFNANPASINAGQSSTLSWGNVTNGNTGPLVRSVTIEPGLGEVGSGASSRTVKPTKTTTYAMTSTGCGGTATKQVTVTVVNPTATLPIAVLMNVDLAVVNIYPAPTGHIMATIKNAGNVTINSTTTLTCSGTKTENPLPNVGLNVGPYTQSLTFNLKAGEKFDQDTQISRDPSMLTLWVTCSITPPSGDSNNSDDSTNAKVK
jgi:hypothetical protein